MAGSSFARIARRVRGGWRRGGALVQDALTTRLPRGWGERMAVDTLRGDARHVTPSSIELSYRLNGALRALTDPGGSNRWLHHRWLGWFETVFDTVGPLLRDTRPFEHVWLGAGARNPLTFPLLVFLAGAGRTWVVEPEPQPSGSEWRWAWGLQEVALRIATRTIESKHFVRGWGDVADFVDPHELFFGDPVKALHPDRVRRVTATIEEAGIPAGSIGLLTSRSVLEHLAEPERSFDTLARVMAPGGVMYHLVDFTAHTAGDLFAFYYGALDQGRFAAHDMLNGLRASDYVRALGSRGFEVTVQDRTMAPASAVDRRRLLPRFRAYDETELSCISAVIVARKAAHVTGSPCAS